MGECKKIMKEDFSIDMSDSDCEAVKRICTAVSTRAARLAAAGIVALVRKINKVDGCSVAVDGSLYKKHPHFAKK
jgi:hexokinase